MQREYSALCVAPDCRCAFYYSGAAAAAGTSYSGAILASRSGAWPGKDQVSRIEAALERAGIKMWEVGWDSKAQTLLCPRCCARLLRVTLAVPEECVLLCHGRLRALPSHVSCKHPLALYLARCRSATWITGHATASIWTLSSWPWPDAGHAGMTKP